MKTRQTILLVAGLMLAPVVTAAAAEGAIDQKANGIAASGNSGIDAAAAKVKAEADIPLETAQGKVVSVDEDRLVLEIEDGDTASEEIFKIGPETIFKEIAGIDAIIENQTIKVSYIAGQDEKTAVSVSKPNLLDSLLN